MKPSHPQPQEVQGEPPESANEGIRGIFQNRLAARQKYFDSPAAEQNGSEEKGDLLTREKTDDVSRTATELQVVGLDRPTTSKSSDRTLSWLEQKVAEFSEAKERQFYDSFLVMSPTGPQRQTTPRYRPEGIHIRFGWSAHQPGAGGSQAEVSVSTAHLHLHDAELVDISQTGLCILVKHLPPGDRPLWVKLESDQGKSLTTVLLRSLSEPAHGCFRLRLSFVATCPDDFLQFAISRSS